MTAKQPREILRERAAALAHPPPSDENASKRLEAVVFTLAYETYAVAGSYVREVIDLEELTPVPGTPAFLAGVINVRGSILAVINIKKFFDLPERGIADAHKVIIVRNEGVEAGLLADTLVGIREIPPGDLEPGLPTLTGIRAEYLQGVTRDSIVLLDVGKILSDEKLIVDHREEARIAP